MTFSPEQIKELGKKLDPSNVSPPKQYGPKGDYIEGWHAIAEANRIFGFDGWSYSIVTCDCVSERPRAIGRDKKDGFGVTYTARVSLAAGGGSREDVGAGHGYDVDCGLAHESAIKEAVTDALKRALRTFGNPFGLALYDKSRANVGFDDPPKQQGSWQAPTSSPYTDYELKWIEQRPKAPRLSEADSATLFAVMSTQLENCSNEADVTEFSADNVKTLSELDDSDWVKIVYRAKQIKDGEG